MLMSLQDAATVLLQHLLQHLFYFILHVRPALLFAGLGLAKQSACIALYYRDATYVERSRTYSLYLG